MIYLDELVMTQVTANIGLARMGSRPVDAGVLWVYLSQLITVIGGPRHLTVGFFAVVPTAYALRRLKGTGPAASFQVQRDRTMQREQTRELTYELLDNPSLRTSPSASTRSEREGSLAIKKRLEKYDQKAPEDEADWKWETLPTNPSASARSERGERLPVKKRLDKYDQKAPKDVADWKWETYPMGDLGD